MFQKTSDAPTTQFLNKRAPVEQKEAGASRLPNGDEQKKGK